MHGRQGRAELPFDGQDGAAARGRDAELVAAVVDALPSPTVVLDPQGVIVLVNSAWVTDGRKHGQAIRPGADYFAEAVSLADDPDGRTLVAELRELIAGERSEMSIDRSMPSPSGTGRLWFHLQGTRVGSAGHVVVTHTDVTARVLAERASSWQARHDHLTELPNRAHLHELINRELHRPDHPAVSVLFLDVDGFKDVNDSLGHEVGDELLRQISARLLGATRAQDTVGRLGGDEFVVLCRDCDTDGATALAERCQAAFAEPFELGGRSLTLGASIGIAGRERRRVRSTELVRDADLAMYAAKAAGRGRVRVFSPDLRVAAETRMQLAAELRDAIAGEQLVLHYQPIVHLSTGACTGVEALVRWQHPARGLLPPSDFVPLAAQHDLMAQLTCWVLRTATGQAAAWDAAGLSLVMNVNISAEHFSAGTLTDDVAAALEASGLPPERLVVELTETSVAEDPTSAAAQLARLRVTGVEVSIDDFGSGFSSISQLVALPAGLLKIDRSLVTCAAGRAGQAAAAIEAVVGLADAFGMRSLAEGVETAEQLAVATALGCTFAQGFHIARPMPAEDIPAWMAARTRGAAPLPLLTDAASLSRGLGSAVGSG
ncbi:putative bifunctional diguanylate cyclase/phosphodiesterase [Blastococcus saxobsidens]|uniref:Putative Diguanylate cyclase (GGDEF) domain-containing protein n=1 Tax=Blastococcus saxobsidens (strain DD2) TaxID=1146883 RepID=H6RV87_BLASD|nr:EAL domain-containing protein [Blastococcus saxobsidens]CCG01964.1 putative Diguanylate cyclase (GGDEF) domain-containing protein [Blastococcus saxobsidens DD2]